MRHSSIAFLNTVEQTIFKRSPHLVDYLFRHTGGFLKDYYVKVQNVKSLDLGNGSSDLHAMFKCIFIPVQFASQGNSIA